MWTLLGSYNSVNVCAVLYTAARVDAALFTAVMDAFYTTVRVDTAFFLLLVDAALHIAVRVDAAPYNAVSVGVAFPLYCGWCMCCPLCCC